GANSTDHAPLSPSRPPAAAGCSRFSFPSAFPLSRPPGPCGRRDGACPHGRGVDFRLDARPASRRRDGVSYRSTLISYMTYCRFWTEEGLDFRPFEMVIFAKYSGTFLVNRTRNVVTAGSFGA